MLSPPMLIARKELMDHLRDGRSLLSSVLYALMGPVVVSLASFSLPASSQASSGPSPLPGLISVFTLAAAFTGGMSVAMDTIAGERERRSLVPLLLNPVSRRDITVGKWLAISAFSAAGLIVTILGFAATWAIAKMPSPANWPYLVLTLGAGLLPLTLLSAAVELLISTACRGVKEAQTYLSLLVFLPMLLGMALVFFPHAAKPWLYFVPVAGQQLALQQSIQGAAADLLQPLVLGWTTIAAAVLIVMAAANRLQRDDIVYGS
jgi:sodium transport system permease protein